MNETINEKLVLYRKQANNKNEKGVNSGFDCGYYCCVSSDGDGLTNCCESCVCCDCDCCD